jgi:aryl-alcohol dehydrogenase-like predicted oxidoreductase
MPLDQYFTLGRSGLRVSRLALGTMTFGQPGWGCDRDVAAAIFDRYVGAGGNFVDTADGYADGASEEITGAIIAERKARDRIVLTTKFTIGGARDGDPNASGNNRKSMLQALEGSLRRLGTDYIDVYILHAWDSLTPVDEVMRGLDDLVTAGKVRYVAFSDVPAWYASRAQTLAEWRGFAPLCALQMEYSLIERGIELEFPAMCEELGMSLMVWGALANGLLSGKYTRDAALDETKQGRLNVVGAHIPPHELKINERSWKIIDELQSIAEELGTSMPAVGINWAANRRAVGSVILGASKLEQIEATVSALDLEIPDPLRARLDDVSAPAPVNPYAFINRMTPRINAGVADKPRGYFARDRA